MSERLRLLFVITQFDTGGVQHQLWLRLKHLDPARYDCRVAVLTGGNSHLLGRVRALGVAVEFLHVDEERALWRRVGRIKNHIARVQPDIVDTLLLWDNTYGTMAAVLARVPLIVAELQSMGDMRAGCSMGFRALEAFAYRFLCDHIVCCSETVRASYSRSFRGLSKKSSVIYDAVETKYARPATDDARRQLGLPLDRLIVGTLGRLHDVKDHETLLRSARRLADLHPDVLVAIGGDGPLRDRLIEQRDRLGLADRVRFLGELTDPQAFHAAIDVFALTSRTEGFPVVLLEAMAAGRPIVSTRVGGVAEAIDDGRNGFLCEAGDDRALAVAMSRLLGDEALRRRVGESARQDVSRYAIQHLVEDWNRVYALCPSQVHRQAAAIVRSRAPGESANLQGVEWPARAARILLWRLCPMDRFLYLVGDLRRRFPGVEIDGVCQAGMAGRLEAAGVRPISYGEGRFSARRLGVRRLLQLRRRYDLVLVPFNQPTCDGYTSAGLCAVWAGRGRAVGLAAWTDSVSPVVALSWGTIVRERCLTSSQLVGDLLMSGLVLLRGALLARRALTLTPSGSTPQP